MSRNQDNGRFLTDLLVKKIRNAGYTGCSNLEELHPNVIAEPPPVSGFSLDSSLIGYDGDGTNGTGDNWANPTAIPRVEGTDIITVGQGGECGADLTGNMDTVNANIQILAGGGCDFNAGDYLLITDCESADLFRSSSVSESSGKETIAHAENVNTANFLSKTYQAGSTIFHFTHTTYFIGISPTTGNPTLYRVVNGKSPEDLVENVQDMQFLYGVDTDANGVVNRYATAAGVTDWSQVLSAGISLLMRSDENNVTMQPQVLTFNGISVNDGENADKRLRNIFNTSVTVRNRVP